MSIQLSRPWDLREFNGRTRSEAVEKYFFRYGIKNARFATVWNFQLPNNWDVEILTFNISDESNTMFRPIVRYRVKDFFPWTTWHVEIPDNRSSHEAKMHAFIKFMTKLYPNAIQDLFPKALVEDNGITKYLN